ncbi:hypothetical protein Pcinc_024757 [Petrolisthes cinctipes]|uniref:Uncharacterized protein n=1 Tax=Petrolisthes cinctipes TaxID=88211 RepID=A0AAE1F9Y0_PETCI|nr:hypothetical protein Pcinc_024757 [Petrolisthes cinctipes]
MAAGEGWRKGRSRSLARAMREGQSERPSCSQEQPNQPTNQAPAITPLGMTGPSAPPTPHLPRSGQHHRDKRPLDKSPTPHLPPKLRTTPHVIILLCSKSPISYLPS